MNQVLLGLTGLVVVSGMLLMITMGSGVRNFWETLRWALFGFAIGIAFAGVIVPANILPEDDPSGFMAAATLAYFLLYLFMEPISRAVMSLVNRAPSQAPNNNEDDHP